MGITPQPDHGEGLFVTNLALPGPHGFLPQTLDALLLVRARAAEQDKVRAISRIRESL
jgi:DNA helicase TIP49 (TBP-interacting protein)